VHLPEVPPSLSVITFSLHPMTGKEQSERSDWSLWCRTASSLRSSIHSAHIRAVFAFLARDLDAVLDDGELRLGLRIAFACRYDDFVCFFLFC
jgi:hypothetical protein